MVKKDKKDKKKKMLELFVKASTPDELFIDTISHLKKLENDFKEVKANIENTTQYVIENKPKTKEELLEMIKPLIPEVKDGITPNREELIRVMKPLIPKIKDGKDGSPDTPGEIRDKITSLKGDERLSVLALKDTEWLKSVEGKMQWSSAGFKVYTNNTLSGDGSFNDPLKVVSGTGGHIIQNSGVSMPQEPKLNFIGATLSDNPGNGSTDVNLTGGTPHAETPIGVINGINNIFTLSNTPTNGNGVLVFLDGVSQYNGIDFTMSGSMVIFAIAPAIGSTIFAYYEILAGAGGVLIPHAETPTGVIDSVNVTFTLSTIPSNGVGVIILLDGVAQYNGIDYTISGSTIIFAIPPIIGSTIFAYYAVLAGGGGSASITSQISLPGQTANITDTPFTIPGIGLYRISYYLLTTTADGAAGTVTLNIKYTDDASARTMSTTPVVLTSLTGFVSGEIIVRLSSGNITYGTVHTGSYGTSVYAVYLTTEKII